VEVIPVRFDIDFKALLQESVKHQQELAEEVSPVRVVDKRRLKLSTYVHSKVG